jgi:hypothetical protein
MGIYVTFYLTYASLSRLHSFKRKAPRWIVEVVIISFLLTINQQEMLTALKITLECLLDDNYVDYMLSFRI